MTNYALCSSRLFRIKHIQNVKQAGYRRVTPHAFGFFPRLKLYSLCGANVILF
jgi:hypothetical protein